MTADRRECCDLHNRNCEPPSELCCWQCTEVEHPGHTDGSQCIAPDLSREADRREQAIEAAARAAYEYARREPFSDPDDPPSGPEWDDVPEHIRRGWYFARDVAIVDAVLATDDCAELLDAEAERLMVLDAPTDEQYRQAEGYQEACYFLRGGVANVWLQDGNS